MVLAERNSELVRNGRRSRGPSPNGHGASSGSASGTAAPGGTGTPETSSDDDNSIKRNGKSKTKQSEYEEKIRVGRDYQAVCPPLIPEQERKPECLNDRALLVWSPTKEIPDTKLEEYISVAKEKYGYNGEQALGMLFWHKHDLERAVMDLSNFTPFPDEWTVEDKVLFEQAFQFHGKSFHRIRQMLPDKSIASLVKYYYSWKKTRHRQSVMDRQEKVKASKEGSSENGSDNGSNEESDNDDKDQTLSSHAGILYEQTNDSSLIHDGGGGGGLDVENQFSNAANNNNNNNNNSSNNNNNKHQSQTTPSIITNSDSIYSNGIAATTNATSSIVGGGSVIGGGGYCSNCGVACNVLHNSPHGKMCFSCHHHWRRTGNKRPTSGPFFGKRSRDRNADRHKRKPPRGMYINHDDIVALASANDNQDELLANIDREIVSLLSQVQLNKQNISALKRKNSDNLDDIRPTENANRINARWTNDEILLAINGVRKYGKDFQVIAETLGTKTEALVRTFYLNNRRRYNLDQLIKKHEAEKEHIAASATSNSTNQANAASSASSTITTTSSASSSANVPANVTGADGGSNNNLSSATIKDEVSQIATKKANLPPSVIDESDNTTSSETAISKSTISTITTSDERKCESSLSVGNMPKDNVIMEIDLDADQPEVVPQPPPAKKMALSVSNQEFPKSSPV
ncbi:REST corepressor isoform X1 [Musca domestica]|uniref:REST corepressor isoform X1 n=1 Tax=Musca domestica TaxID=7370 RepID=A0A9J7D1H7_MUSDO|nr:REST corepressor isoform X1 [Musca domestica]XP_019894470.2 REST corepressor isoform X1 [Musca domestica]XP_019894471.2 REST corepressor isoform X1 [Musca domestica]